VSEASWPRRVLAVYVDLLGDLASLDEGFGPVSVDVPANRWLDAVTAARDRLGCTFFDWLSAVDELPSGFRVVCHLAARRTGAVEHVLVRTALDREAPAVASVAEVFAGARWHERETHEMFGIGFTDAAGHALAMEPLLLADEFEGHPLRKEFVLASRVAKAWPGQKEPGESDRDIAARRPRRRMQPPGVPAPGTWGPEE
jgi:NADH:ubiquinone oxidoreductase subunit C